MVDTAPQDKLTELKSTFSSAQKILILIKKDPSFDGLASALGLYLAIKKIKPEVDVYCETPAVVEQANLVGINKIRNEIGNKNLIISFDYVDGAIEKVSYNIEGQKFNLVIQPKTGQPTISPEKMTYSYSGLAADLVFCLETSSLEDLGKIAFKEKEFFEKAALVNIDHRSHGQFAKYNVSTPGVLSCAELVLSLFHPLELQIDGDIATNLLAGIEYASGSFSDPRLDATTFETIAYLLKQGAKRQKVPSLTRPMTASTPTTNTNVRVEEKPLEEKKEEKPKVVNQPPVDWLQPKIYKGSQLL